MAFNEKFCPVCGRAHPLNAGFCSNCGQRLPTGILLQQPAETVGEEGTVRRPWQSRYGPSAEEAAQTDEEATVAAPPRASEAAGGVGAAQATRQRRAHSRAASATISTAGTTEPLACALLSFFFPGIGQILTKQVVKGVVIILAAFVAGTYFDWGLFRFPMLLGQIVVAVDAYKIAERRRAGKTVDEWEWGLQDKGRAGKRR